jgi:hypothetical protein
MNRAAARLRLRADRHGNAEVTLVDLARGFYGLTFLGGTRQTVLTVRGEDWR